MQHQKAGNLVRKDQARRLRYQEAQKHQSKIKTSQGWLPEQSKGQVKSYLSKLVK